jgi:NhaP-type Na+/H+ or K+/H+ antiporter
MDSYIVVVALFGAVVLLTAWLPMVLKELPLSLPIACVALGAVIFMIPGSPSPVPDPSEHLKVTQRLTELVVIVALMGAGLKLDRPLSWRSGLLTWRLLAIAMPLTIAALAVLGHALLGLGLASALLLGAALAPTDPVLASDVQVGAPGHGKEDAVRFALTSEAGLNDGLAFPFVNLAVALTLATGTVQERIAHWALVDVAWKVAVGLALGWLIGAALGLLTFRLPKRSALSRTGDGFVALGITGIAYGLTEMAHGYGFLAVFVSALAFRSVERNHDYHETLHDFVEQLERLLMMVLLVLFGAAVSEGKMLEAMSWPVLVFALIAIFLVRPLAGWLSLLGSAEPGDEKAVISFFGIRGVGSFYYLAFALGVAPFDSAGVLWATVSVVALISIFLHGILVTPVMRHLDARRRR